MFWSSLLLALRAIRRNLLRSFLTIRSVTVVYGASNWLAENADDNFFILDTRQIAETMTGTTKVMTDRCGVRLFSGPPRRPP